MKRLGFIEKALPLSCLLSLCLFSCVDRKTNYIIPGIFYDDAGYSLTVTPISDEDFIKANGVNVLEDEATNRSWDYYELNMSHMESGERFTFLNLRESGYPQQPCAYVDDNGTTIYCKINQLHYFMSTESGESFTFRAPRTPRD